MNWVVPAIEDYQGRAAEARRLAALAGDSIAHQLLIHLAVEYDAASRLSLPEVRNVVRGAWLGPERRAGGDRRQQQRHAPDRRAAG